MGKLTGKVAVITGSASGIGRESAIRMAAEGCHVVGGDLNPEGGDETAELCRAKGADASFIRTDVTVESDIEALIAHAVEKFGGVDILFNNAGAGGAVGPIESVPIEGWDRTQAILLRSAFLGMKHAVPEMRKRGGGSIISTSSIAGLAGYPNLHAYCAAKAGLINLTRSAAVELGASRIRVNCICPGDIVTPMRSSGLSFEELEVELAKHQPIPRAGHVEDIASAVLYLASDDAEWVTGLIMPIDGGQTIGVWTYGQNADLGHTRQSTFLEPSYIRKKKAAETAA
jgi:NAD(P)-dependent dehydrogenase (short-subunit alcohol dehydrogenase family)